MNLSLVLPVWPAQFWKFQFQACCIVFKLSFRTIRPVAGGLFLLLIMLHENTRPIRSRLLLHPGYSIPQPYRIHDQLHLQAAPSTKDVHHVVYPSAQLMTVSPSLSLRLSLLPLPLLNPPGKLAPGCAFPNPGIG